MLPSLPIIDSLFGHAYSTSSNFKPSFFEWERNPAKWDKDFVFLTDRDLQRARWVKEHGKKVYAWLVESPSITPECYNYVRQNHLLFDKIFAHNKDLLTLPNVFFVPIGGCHLLENEIRLDHEKSQLVSMMYSNKNWVGGHQFRHQVANFVRGRVDLMGSGVNGQHVRKGLACCPYKFSVVVENNNEPHYFTEKIVDCFLSECVPIYWGTPTIGQFFNSDGFFIFNSLEELDNILSSDLEWFYNARKEAIRKNFETAKTHKVGEDYLWLNYAEIL
jgi:hypothetical protein